MFKKCFCLLAVLLMALCVSAQKLTLQMNSGQTLTGTFVDATDTTVTILFGDENVSAQPLVIPASRIESGRLPHKGKLFVQDGKIIIQTSEDLKAQMTQKSVDNPNFAVGNALKKSGSVCLGLGVPCLAAGLATCIAGRVGGYSVSSLGPRGRCIDASYYLLGIGASLTIVGIPLYSQGKKLMNLNVTATGNGLGVAMVF